MSKIKINITEEMWIKANNRVKETINLGKIRKEVKNKKLLRKYSLEDAQRINLLIGFLGEIVFSEYLKENNKYFTDKESKLVKYSVDKTDLGDFFCSRTQNSIDIKTTIQRNPNLNVTCNILNLRPIKYYVLIQIVLKDYKKLFELENIKYATILGQLKHHEIKKQPKITKTNKPFFSAYYKELNPTENILDEFWTNDEFNRLENKLEVNEKLYIKDIEFGIIYISLDRNFKKTRTSEILEEQYPELKTYIEKYIKRDLKYKLPYNLIHYRINNNLLIVFGFDLLYENNKERIDPQTYIRNIKKSSSFAKANNLSFYLPIDFELIKSNDFETTINGLRKYLEQENIIFINV